MLLCVQILYFEASIADTKLRLKNTRSEHITDSFDDVIFTCSGELGLNGDVVGPAVAVVRFVPFAPLRIGPGQRR